MVLRGISNKHGKVVRKIACQKRILFTRKKNVWRLIFKNSIDCHAFKDQDFFTDTKCFVRGNNDSAKVLPKTLSAREKKTNETSVAEEVLFSVKLKKSFPSLK